ncbi:MAG TPA: L,D-transpeptidase family protein [Gemmatimonadota bacterium]|nr:L,D-transpeptidase family protein [Gemmatimonadota bacterium]
MLAVDPAPRNPFGASRWCRLVRGAAISALLALLSACGRDGEAPDEADVEPARVLWSDDTLTGADIERGRLDASWREAVKLDRRFVVEAALDTVAIPETWADIGVAAAVLDSAPDGAEPAVHLPLYGDVEGPSVLYVQILLDRARFSPGILDGKWGKNTEKAVYWMQHREGLPATGLVDSVTYARLRDLGGDPDRFFRDHVLSDEDVSGPFEPIPASVYRQARLSCLCYESLSEKLAELFHTGSEILAELNPGAVLDSLTAGETIRVPDLTGRGGAAGHAAHLAAEDRGAAAKVVVSGRGFYLHALDAGGRIVHHFPTTLGSRYDPSPAGKLEVVSVTPDPWFHYQPRLLSGVDRSAPNALLPPGPNSPVGRVWIKLSKPHYGIHGTREPATIGYETSSGCVRLTNWDALTLAGLVSGGVPVEFEETLPEVEATPAAGTSAP